MGQNHRKWRTIVALAALLLATGCQANRSRDRHTDRTVIVESTTQPGVRAAGEPARAIRVIVDDPATERSAEPATIDALVGQPCRVQFRRDALGLVADAPTPPLSEGLFKRPVFLDGVLIQAGRDGVLIDGETGKIWIPWSSVLLIEARQ